MRHKRASYGRKRRSTYRTGKRYGKRRMKRIKYYRPTRGGIRL